MLFIAGPTRSLPLPVLYSSTQDANRLSRQISYLIQRVEPSLLSNSVYDFLCKATEGSHILRTHDSADSIVDLPADAPRSANRRGGAELFLRHAAFLRSHSAVGELDCKMKNKVGTLLIANRKLAGLTPSDVTPVRLL